MASAGRPKKVNTQVDIQVKDSKEIDIQALIKQVTEEVTKQVETKYENKIKEMEKSLDSKNDELKTLSNKKKYKFIADHTKVRIQSNVDGKFIFQEDRGKIRVFIQLDNFGDSCVVSYEELRTFYTSKPNYIRKGQIAIVDVYSDEDINLDDVIKDLRLENIYMNDRSINPKYIDSLFTENIKIKEFESLVTNTPEMAETVLEVAYILYRKGLFNDNAKMNFIRQIFRNPNLFK